MDSVENIVMYRLR